MKKTLDPRFLRTRRLIMDAFLQLAMEKDFKEITIKDITSRATVNRATFYYHFFDKHDLLEKVLAEDVLQGVLSQVEKEEVLTVDTLQTIFNSLLQFHLSLANQCMRSYEAFTPKIEMIIKEELARVIRDFLKKQYEEWPYEKVELHSIKLSWTIYGISTKYVGTGEQPNEEIIRELLEEMI